MFILKPKLVFSTCSWHEEGQLVHHRSSEWVLLPHLHMHMYLLHCFKVYPSKENNLTCGLGLTQSSENSNPNLVSGNFYHPGIILRKQVDPVIPVTWISWPFVVISPIEKSVTHSAVARKQTFAHSLWTLAQLTGIFHPWRENDGNDIVTPGFGLVLWKIQP